MISELNSFFTLQKQKHYSICDILKLKQGDNNPILFPYLIISFFDTWSYFGHNLTFLVPVLLRLQVLFFFLIFPFFFWVIAH